MFKTAAVAVNYLKRKFFSKEKIKLCQNIWDKYIIKSVIVFNIYTSAVLHACHGIGNIYRYLHNIIFSFSISKHNSTFVEKNVVHKKIVPLLLSTETTNHFKKIFIKL